MLLKDDGGIVLAIDQPSAEPTLFRGVVFREALSVCFSGAVGGA